MTDILRLSLPLTVWIIGFAAAYALQGFACSRHWPVGADPRPWLVVAWGVAVVLQSLILLFVISSPSSLRFVKRTATALAVAALVAALWTLSPVLVISICD